MFSPHKSFAGTYRQVHAETGVDNADSRQLIGMLFDGALTALSAARGAITRGDIAAKGEQIGRAARIVEEGLRGGLDLEAGGALAANLDALYRYIGQRLTVANLRNDEQALAECAGLIVPLRDAWRTMEIQAAAA